MSDIWKTVSVVLAFLLVISIFYNLKPSEPAVSLEEYKKLKDSLEGVKTENDMLKLENEELRQRIKEMEMKGRETIGGFTFTGDELCSSNGKPIVYFFGTSWCPHCKWEKPIFKNVTQEFSDLIEVRFYEIDVKEPEKSELEVFQKYNPKGSIPTIIIGCRYTRAGSGEAIGEEKEKETLEALICKITQGKVDVCEKYKSLLKEIP